MSKKWRFRKLHLISSAIFAVAAISATIVSCENKEEKEKKDTTDKKSGSDKASSENKTTATNKKNYVYDAKNNYYESLNGLKGEELREALRKLQAEKVKTIKTNYDTMPEFFNRVFIDKFYDKDNTIIDLYGEKEGTDISSHKTFKSKAEGEAASEKEGERLKREFLVRFTKDERFRKDFHIVWPADEYINSIRVNNPFSEFGDVEKVEKTFKNGTKSGMDKNGRRRFEPIDMFKGDVARALLYFSVTYAEGLPKSDRPFSFSGKDPYLSKDFLETYLKWNKLDVVDEFNVHLNNEIAKENNNVRNPFVDYPDLTESLYGENPKPFVNKGILTSVKNS